MPTLSLLSFKPDTFQRITLMKNLVTFRTLTLVAGMALTSALFFGPARAVDNMSSSGDVDLTSIRAKIKKKDFSSALSELRELSEDTQNADVYNLLGFTLRKIGDYDTSLSYYTKALELQPDHRAGPGISRRTLPRNREDGQGERAARCPH